MINHLAGHSPVDTYIFPGDKSSLAETQKKNHIGNIHGIARSSCWMLPGIRTRILCKLRINPSRRNRIYPDLSRQADSQGMSERRNQVLRFL